MTNDKESPTEKTPVDRSPSFPVIPLKTSIKRLEQFENKFGRHPSPFKKAGLAWGMKEGSGQANRVLAALKAFDLLKYQGAGDSRTIAISENGRTYLRAQQDNIKKDVLKKAALKPKAIAKFWPEWGADRPVDEICLDDLVLTHGYNENAAPLFLRIYDQTIAYAGLSTHDKINELNNDPDSENGDSGNRVNDPPPPPPRGKIAPMEGERIVFTEENNPNQYVKLVVSGEVDGYLLDAISDYVNRQKRRLKIMTTPVHGVFDTEYTNDEEGHKAEERDRKLNEEINSDE